MMNATTESAPELRDSETAATEKREPAAGRPFLTLSTPPGVIRGVVLVAHGGREHGTEAPGRFSPVRLRMLPFARHLARKGASHGVAVAQLGYRVAGYNDGDPVRDVEWALNRIRRDHAAPVCVVGHSMGSRAALQAAGAEGVVGVVALAPWCPPTDPVEQLAGRSVLFLHGVNDRITYPRYSHEFALRAREVTPQVCRFALKNTGHAMLRRASLWHSLTTSFAMGALGLADMPDQIASALALPPAQACAVSA